MKQFVILLGIASALTGSLYAATNTNTQALAAAQQWLALTDAGQVTQSWQTAAAHFRSAVTPAKWEQALKGARQPLGELRSRTVKSTQTMKSLPGAAGGPYTILRFDSTFANNRQMVETVTLVKETDAQWRAVGYYVTRSDPVSLAFTVKLVVSAVGMILVALLAGFGCWHFTRVQLRWFWVGAALWAVAVVLKIAAAYLMNPAMFSFLKEQLPFPWYVAVGGLYVGLHSSVFEMGITLAAVLVWRQLGSDSHRAIAIGVGAGVVEALLLGVGQLITAAVLVVGLPGAETMGGQAQAAVGTTSLFWLAPPVERCVAILCHGATRALVLLGVAQRRPMLVAWGVLIFALLDSVAGAFHVSGQMGKASLWWVELALLPFGVLSLVILNWCFRRRDDLDQNRR
ncbi:MAG: DUF4019 domain-containing protein [Verrucomicrobia bacterium]|nr:DUF4019 domain-containing protein [Verrucomicrobiota bacterium]